MKKKLLLYLTSLIPLVLSSCNSVDTKDSSDSGSSEEHLSSISIPEDNISSSFLLIDENGRTISPNEAGDYYLIDSGIYTAKGKIENKRIYIDAPNKNIELELDGASISNNKYSPIFVQNVSIFNLNINRDSSNYLYDNRSSNYSKKDVGHGLGTISVINGDIKLTGKGALYITSSHNSGVYAHNELFIGTNILLIDSYDDGIVGDDQITFDNNPHIDIRTNNNGIRTTQYNFDLTKANHGSIFINSGELLINSQGDGIDAAHSVGIGKNLVDNTYSLIIEIYTNAFSSFISQKYKYSEVSSYKGIKAKEVINVYKGILNITSVDDGIHADKNVIIEDYHIIEPEACINIIGGKITICTSDDAIHADGTFTLLNGIINIDVCHEGVEANIVIINGGQLVVLPSDYQQGQYSGLTIQTDDAINATEAIIIDGGYIDVSVNSGGTSDCIDSNGIFTLKNGVVIVRGPNKKSAGAIECIGNVLIEGGTLLASGSIISSNGEVHIPLNRHHLAMSDKGNHIFAVDGTQYSYFNYYDYENTYCFSNSTITQLQ